MAGPKKNGRANAALKTEEAATAHHAAPWQEAAKAERPFSTIAQNAPAIAAPIR